MSDVGGTDVVIDDNENVTAGTGLKLALYTKERATTSLPALYVVGQTDSPFSADSPATEDQVNSSNPQMKTMRVSMLRGIAKRANAYGEAIAEQLYIATVVDGAGVAHAGRASIKIVGSTVADDGTNLVVTLAP